MQNYPFSFSGKADQSSAQLQFFHFILCSFPGSLTIQNKISIFPLAQKKMTHSRNCTFLFPTCHFLQMPSELIISFPSDTTLISTLQTYSLCKREASFKVTLLQLSPQLVPSELVFIEVKLELRSATSGNPINSYILLQVPDIQSQSLTQEVYGPVSKSGLLVSMSVLSTLFLK